ncbi:helix-turn-helix domain-containing protein [Streptomyces sp. NBC_01485]|uniref:helix-turn-helix domain-containing protein n=1 Tax=Streptomyces sp. NBC_01485 TaxID=2903884 RepID=UPI002E361E4D|nr:helix-turn-helix domain-containing protein [Streptomyces sp. NBC_01485]
MDTENPSAPPCAESRTPRKNHPHAGGLTHDNTRHTTRFTVIGNHLAQHKELTLLAIGLAVHLQSLPAGVRVDIKSLTARFPEGATRIAAALRELETHGYLRRERSRVPDGRIVTRTVSCNQPGGRGSAPEPVRPPVRRPAPPRKKLPPVPQPAYPAPALLQTAVDLLATLRRDDPRLLLSATDADHLAPGVAAWLEREVTPTAVRHALTADLPEDPLRRPAALLAHRLADKLPPLPPYRAPAPPQEPRPRLENCDGCDRAFKSTGSDRCGDCRQRSTHH